jgi:hypothetical protein
MAIYRPRRIPRRVSVRIAAALIAAALGLACIPAALAAEPRLALIPDRAPCPGSLTLAGQGFPPGQVVSFGVRQLAPYSDHGRGGLNPTTVASDGTLRLTLPVVLLVVECASSSPPTPGTRYVVQVTPEGKNPDSQLFASAEFTLTSTNTPGLPNTGGGGRAGPALVPLAGLGLVLLLATACAARHLSGGWRGG